MTRASLCVEACVHTLLDLGADVDAVDVEGCTPLHRASSLGAAVALLDGGANPKVIERCSMGSVL